MIDKSPAAGLAHSLHRQANALYCPKRVGIVDEKGGKEAGVRYRAALEGRVIGTVVAQGTRPGAKQPVDKLYAVIKFAPWDWTIGFGDYIDDIDDAFWRNTVILPSIGAVLMLVIAGMAWSMLRAVVRQPGGEPRYAADIVTDCRRRPDRAGGHRLQGPHQPAVCHPGHA